jgi:transposase
MTEMRPAIIKLHEKGLSERKIAALLDVPKTTAHRHIKRFEESGSHQNKPKGKPEKTARNRRNIQRAKGMIQRNPTTKANSVRKLARKLGIGRDSAHRILREDLGKKPFKYLKRQKLNEAAKKKRLDRSRALLERFSRRKHRKIVFSDEKLFDIEQVGLVALFSVSLFLKVFNPQNDRIWADEAPETEQRVVERTQKPGSVMVWGAIHAAGKTPLVFVEAGVKIDKRVYMDMLREHFFPWAAEHLGDRGWCFQQDGAPGHKAIETQEMLAEECPDFIKVDTHWRNNDGEWPPNSPDLNPMDYSVWSLLEAKACAKSHLNLESLKRALVKAWNEISVETLAKIVDNFPKRLQACIEAEGGHFE